MMNGTEDDVMWAEDHEEMCCGNTCWQWLVNSVMCLYVLLRKYSLCLDSEDYLIMKHET